MSASRGRLRGILGLPRLYRIRGAPSCGANGISPTPVHLRTLEFSFTGKFTTYTVSQHPPVRAPSFNRTTADAAGAAVLLLLLLLWNSRELKRDEKSQINDER
ncbi:hypothetical protein PV327_011335 [Microctonus hyperodae]|uniref:Uncharacterized protein n=1 Tax=Microctonus hyperodae TaxID=165561 RepID=A0AA39FL56_MICHY|nr:hypothetical protein PV327_011335 [Microctonus hyperodae]